MKIRARKYGVTPEQVQALYDQQGGKCAICDDVLPSRFHIDHDHKTGTVRGLLCPGCNLALGHFDDPEIMRRALAYVNKSAPLLKLVGA